MRIIKTAFVLTFFSFFLIFLSCLLNAECQLSKEKSPPNIQVKRLLGNPMITPESDETLGKNINGPSLIRVPKWVKNPLGKYYLHIADHNRRYIRLAYSNQLSGPWHIYKQGTLQLSQFFSVNHIASPDAVVDEDHKRIRLYYHGLTTSGRMQHTRVALSQDGLNFTKDLYSWEAPTFSPTDCWQSSESRRD